MAYSRPGDPPTRGHGLRSRRPLLHRSAVWRLKQSGSRSTEVAYLYEETGKVDDLPIVDRHVSVVDAGHGGKVRGQVGRVRVDAVLFPCSASIPAHDSHSH